MTKIKNDKRTNTDLQNNKQKTKDRTTPIKIWGELRGVPEG
jgi:hypothetical protein